MRRRWMGASVALCTLVVVVLSGSASADNDQHGAPSITASAFDAVLTAANEVPPTTSTGLGLASLMLSADGNTLSYTVELTGATSTVSAAHIHLGQPGQNGEVVVNLCGAGSAPACVQEGVIAVGAVPAANLVGSLSGHALGDLISALRSGGAYVNVHTANFPNGELRGQVTARGDAQTGSDNNGRDDGQGNSDHQHGNGHGNGRGHGHGDKEKEGDD